MELPEDVIALIKQYSMPISNPNWRNLHIMTDLQYYVLVRKVVDEWYRKDSIFVRVQTNFKPILTDTLVRRYILRYKILYSPDFT